jgi:Domain of unknown function (DUF4150)
MHCACQGPSLDIAIPDVCKTPAVPFPHPDFGLGFTAVPNVTNIYWMCMCAHNKKTKIPLTFGDNAGIGLGVRKPRVMSYSKKTTGSNNFLIKGSPGVRLTSMTQQNGGNAVGLQLTPGQLKCMNFMP